MFKWWVGAMWRPQMPLSHLKSRVPGVYPHVQQLYHRDCDGRCIPASSQRMLLRSRSWQQTLCWPKPSPLHAIMHWAIDDPSAKRSIVDVPTETPLVLVPGSMRINSWDYIEGGLWPFCPKEWTEQVGLGVSQVLLAMFRGTMSPTRNSLLNKSMPIYHVLYLIILNLSDLNEYERWS